MTTQTADGIEPKPPINAHRATLPMRQAVVRAVGIYLIAAFLAQIIFLMCLWPSVDATGNSTQQWSCGIIIPSIQCDIKDEARIISIVLISGAMGAVVIALRSFSMRVGKSELEHGWGWWYVLRPIEGSMIALTFYLMIRGGLLNASASGTPNSSGISLYGVAGIALLVGMFSQDATAKLKELAQTMFATAPQKVVSSESDLARGVPVISKVDPPQVAQDTADAVIKVTGKNFDKKSEVRIEGATRATKFVSDTELSIQLTAEDTKASDTKLKLTVYTPPPGGGESKEQTVITIVA